MSNYQKVQFIAWGIHTGPQRFLCGSRKISCGMAYSGIAAPNGQRRLDILHQCVDISARIGFTQRAIETAAAHAESSSNTLKIFLAPEFLYRGAAGAYLHDLLNGWTAKNPFGTHLPAPYDCSWDGLFGGLRTLVADDRFQDWIFVFGTAVSAAFATRNGQIQSDTPDTPGCGYNTALIQRGGADPDHRKSCFVTRKHLLSAVDFINFSLDHSLFSLINIQHESAQNCAILDRLAVPDDTGLEGSSIFRFPGVCSADGNELIFGLEICLDHACSHNPLDKDEATSPTGRLANAGVRVDIQLVPSCGMELMSTSLALAPIVGNRSHSYAFNCDGSYTLTTQKLGGHAQLWTEKRNGEQYTASALETVSDCDADPMRFPVDSNGLQLKEAILNPNLQSFVNVDLKNLSAYQLWNSHCDEQYLAHSNLTHWPGGAGAIHILQAVPLRNTLEEGIRRV